MAANARTNAQLLNETQTLQLRVSHLEQIVAEQAKAVEKFHMVAESSPTAMVMINHAGQIILVNAQTEKLFGYARDQLLGQPVELLVPERYRQKHPTHLAGFFARPETRSMGVGRELFGRRKDGSEFPVEIGLNPIHTSEGLVVLAAVVDITERRRADELFRLAVESAPNAMVMVNQDGQMVLVNTQAETLFEYRRDEMLGQPVEILVPERFRVLHPGHRTSFFARPETRAMGMGRELFGRRKSGTEFPIEIGLNPIQTASGLFVLSAIVDITSRKRAEESLLERSRLILLSADVGMALNHSDALQDMLRHCSESMVHNLGAVVARIWTLNNAEKMLELQASAGLYTHLNGPHSRIPLGKFKIGRIAQERSPHLTNDVAHDPLISDPDWARREGMVAFAGYPLIVDDRLVGVMAMFARQPLTQATLDAMAAVANQIAAGIERKRSEEKLKFTQFSIDHVSSAVFWADGAGRFFDVNEAACRLTGYDREELLGLHVYEVDSNITIESWRQTWDALRQQRAVALESRLRRKDGSEFPTSVYSSLLEVGGRECSCTFLQDVTERKQAEAAQRHSDLRFRAIFNQTFEFVTLLDTAGAILEVNQSALDFRDLKLADVVGMSLWESPWLDLSPQLRDQAQQAVRSAAAGHFVRQELAVNDKHGKLRIFDFSVKPVLNEAKQVELLITEARDITEQKRLEEQFRQAQKMEAVGKLAGGVAHDFNNLLTVVNGYSEIALDELRQGDPLREYVEQIRVAAMRAAALTRQLLAFSRKQVLMPVVLDLNALFAELERMLDRLIGDDVDLVFRPTADLWRVRVDSGQMEQVVMNLVINARDAMPRGGKVTIETTNIELDETYADIHPDIKAGEYVLVAVSDTGCGMDRATIERIFEPFFTTKGPEIGTGLGLATVYGIVKQSGGHIEVYSEPDRGAVFKVYLPRDQDAVSSGPAKAAAQPNLHGSETILLVEDADGVRALARMLLQRKGYHVLEARNGGEALLICEQHREPIHLLATDVVMPEMSGRELAERLKGLRPDMKVLYMSGYMDDAIVRHGLLNADVPFLQKPYTSTALAQKVRDVLDRASF